MSSGTGPSAFPLTSVGRVEMKATPGFTLRADDHGAFRALEPGTDAIVVLRPEADGLVLERREGRELVPWTAIHGLTLTFTPAGRARVPTVRVLLAAGPPIDFAHALAPGADGLPPNLGPGQGVLVRVERFRMLAAAIAASSGLAPLALTPEAGATFHQGPRGVPIPDLAVRPRVLPRWMPPAGLILSIAALVLVTGGITGALAITFVIAFHEFGHAFAMRAFGVRVRGMLFIPFIGAGTLTEHGFATRWDEVRVSLAGPLTGLPLAAVMGLALATHLIPSSFASTIGAALLWALGVNVLNLVPMHPLDGGRVLLCLTARLPATLRALIAYGTIVAIGVPLLLVTTGPLRISVAVFLFISVALTRMNLRRHSLQSWMHRLPKPIGALRSALRDVTYSFTGRAREDVDGGVAPTHLASRQIVAVLGFYAVESVALCGATAVFFASFPHLAAWLRSNA